MKHILNKISNLKYDIITHVKSGDNTFNIVSKGQGYIGILNGYEVIEIPSNKKYSEKVQFVLYDILEGIRFKRSSLVILENNKKSPINFKNLEGAIFKAMPINANKVRCTLDPKFQVEKAVDYRKLQENLKFFIKKIQELVKVLMLARDDALSLTKGYMIQTMWGAKEMQDILDVIHQEIDNNEEWEKSEFFENMILRSLQRLFHNLDENTIKICGEEKKMIGRVLIPNILSNYENLKKIVMEAMYAVAPLVNIDDKFKEKTSYPATMFLKGSMLDNLREDYNKIKKFILSIPQLEEDVVYPLDFMRVQFLTK